MNKYTNMRILENNEWSLVFYVDEQGNEPVKEFLAGLDIKTQTRYDWSIEQLRVRNITACFLTWISKENTKNSSPRD